MRKPFSKPVSISKHGGSHRWKHHILDIFITIKFLLFSKFRVKKPTKPLEKGEPVFFRKLLLKFVALSGAEMWLIRSQKSWF